MTTLFCSTLKTPQIMELSGFGRKDVLKNIGIPLKVDLPGVGENVQEHIFVGLSWGKLCTNVYLIVSY